MAAPGYRPPLANLFLEGGGGKKYDSLKAECMVGSCKCHIYIYSFQNFA